MSYGLNYKIPILNGFPNAGAYKEVPFDLKNPHANEPLVKIADYGIAGENFYARTDGHNAPYHKKIPGSIKHIWCRKTVAEKLVEVNARLRPKNVELYAWDAYRPIECQQGLWDFFWDQALEKFPKATEHELRQYVLRFVSDPTSFDANNPRTWPVHASGGAIDLTLREIATGKLLNMGMGFDEMVEAQQSDKFEREIGAGERSETDPQAQNRRLLHWAMTQEGFINYCFEFWHFDYGDQMYVLHSKLLGLLNNPEGAWYGYVESPEPR